MLCRKCCKPTSKILDKFCTYCGKGVMSFGKYKNYTFMYVMLTDPEYCNWLLDIPGEIPVHIKDFLNFLKQTKK